MKGMQGAYAVTSLGRLAESARRCGVFLHVTRPSSPHHMPLLYSSDATLFITFGNPANRSRRITVRPAAAPAADCSRDPASLDCRRHRPAAGTRPRVWGPATAGRFVAIVPRSNPRSVPTEDLIGGHWGSSHVVSGLDFGVGI